MVAGEHVARRLVEHEPRRRHDTPPADVGGTDEDVVDAAVGEDRTLKGVIRPDRGYHPGRRSVTSLAARGMTVARLLVMDPARRHGATRNALAATVAMLAVLPLPAFAENGPNLILPLVTAIAVASAASKTPQMVGIDRSGRSITSLLPSQLRIEDGYEIDVEDYIGRRTPRALADSDRIVSFDVMHRRRNGWMFSFAYDTEHRGPLAGTSDILRCVLDHRF